MKFISWNVNGLRACVGKGFEDIFARLDADFVCLQETKLQAGQIELPFEGYQSYWDYAEKKGYSGTVIFTRHQPLSVAYGMGIEEHDHEGRVVTLEMDDFYLVNVYTPNAQDELKRIDYRMQWEDDLRTWAEIYQYEPLLKVCPHDREGQRQEMRGLLETMQNMNAEAKSSLWHKCLSYYHIKHVRNHCYIHYYNNYTK